jgi:protein O-GlcNAc transferase
MEVFYGQIKVLIEEHFFLISVLGMIFSGIGVATLKWLISKLFKPETKDAPPASPVSTSTVMYNSQGDQQVTNINPSDSAKVDNVHVGDVKLADTILIKNTFGDPKAEEAYLALVKQVGSLAMSDAEKTTIIQSQQATITRLVEQKSTSKKSDKYDSALAALAKGDPSQADKFLDEALAGFEQEIIKAAELYREKGALWFANDTSKALVSYQRALELAPDNMDAWNSLGHLYQRTGALNKAEEAYLHVLNLADGSEAFQAIAYGNLGVVYQTRGELDKAVMYYEKALAIDEALGHQEDMAIDYGNLGVVYQIRGELDKAVMYYEKALAINEAQGYQEGMANQYSNLGIVYQIRGELDKAVMYYEKALVINEAQSYQEGMAIDYGNLGIVYKTRGELDKAVMYYEKALAIDEALGYQEGMANQYGNLGVVYQIRGELDKAVMYYEKALAIDEALSHQVGIANHYGNLGIVYKTRRELDKAVMYYEKSLAINEALGYQEGMANQYGNLGGVYQISGELDKAVMYYEKALAIFETIGATAQIEQMKHSLEIIKK